ncbi:hypothetical protein KC19_2G052900 [Ceratodon purpureus]|uniref:Uncharacterized protein n=1 Tax=Ceratodon purpureus TaxID=3225 RepID=A0A8T0ISH9_CERPU|nr:hypothetical protein KC19_2G052900 [Ceratodon purpureus]
MNHSKSLLFLVLQEHHIIESPLILQSPCNNKASLTNLLRHTCTKHISPLNHKTTINIISLACQKPPIFPTTSQTKHTTTQKQTKNQLPKTTAMQTNNATRTRRYHHQQPNCIKNIARRMKTYEQPLAQVQSGPHLQLALPHPDMMNIIPRKNSSIKTKLQSQMLCLLDSRSNANARRLITNKAWPLRPLYARQGSYLEPTRPHRDRKHRPYRRRT